VAVVLALVQTKQIRINTLKETKQNTVNTNIRIAKTPTHIHTIYITGISKKIFSLFLQDGEMHLLCRLLHIKQKKIEGSVLLTTISCVRPFSKHSPRLHITTASTLNPSYLCDICDYNGYPPQAKHQCADIITTCKRAIPGQ